jgi:transcription elongation GreA/GreB family factor
MIKKEIHQALKLKLNEKINELENLLKDVQVSTAQDSKSSAGDKHETATSMAQLEQEKLTKQIQGFLDMRQTLQGIDLAKTHTLIDVGSLIETNNGWWYFSVSMGSLTIGKNQVFCLSIQAPIGQLLKGKKVGESVLFNQKTTQVLSIQ